MRRLAVLAMAAVLPLAANATEAAGGQAVFMRWCTHCHGAQAAAPGTLRLAWNRGDAPTPLTAREDLSAAYVRQVVRRGLHEMPPFRSTEISPADLDAVVTFLTRQP